MLEEQVPFASTYTKEMDSYLSIISCL